MAKATRATDTCAIDCRTSMTSNARSLSIGGKSKLARRRGVLRMARELAREKPARKRAPDQKSQPLVTNEGHHFALELAAEQ
jgi:hypothetical protein